MAITPPQLATLDQKPSWHNRTGRVDRSACADVRASEVAKELLLEPLATGARGKGLGGRAQVELSAEWLWQRHCLRQPFALLGDWRTIKSNAMKLNHQDARSAKRETGGGTGPINPNRGAASTKMLGLPSDWSQVITIERHRLHERLSQHFLVCPVCGCRAATAGRGPGTTGAGSAKSARSPALPGRSLKLYLPLCTQAELTDAMTAWLWLQTWQDHPLLRRPVLNISDQQSDISNVLIARYAPLWPPRTLACRRCLGLRYGEVKSR